MRREIVLRSVFLTMICPLGGAAWAQGLPGQIAADAGHDTAKPTQFALENTAPAIPASTSPDFLALHFESGSTAIRPQDEALLDHASRLYRDAQPVIMIVSGGTDSVGTGSVNLAISEARAQAVLKALVARGIPVDRFQVLAKGKTDLAIHTADGVAEPGNRVVEIRWR